MEKTGKKNPLVRVLGIILAAVVVLAAICCALQPRAVSAVWHNLTVEKYDLDKEAAWENGTAYMNVPYADVSEAQYVNIYVPAAEAGAPLPKLYVIIHGGGFISNDAESRQAVLMYQYFRDHGYACATINYRLAQEAGFPGAVEDCKTAIRFLRANAAQYGYDADTFAVFGESAGGYLATMCAGTNDQEFNDQPYIGEEEYLAAGGEKYSAEPDVLVDYYGHVDNEGEAEDWKRLGIPNIVFKIANSWITGDVLHGYEDIHSYFFRKNMTEMTQEEKDVVDPHTYLAENLGNGRILDTWIVHGDADITVPYLQSERLYEYLSGLQGSEHVSYHLVPGMGHASDPLYSDEILGELKAFLDERL